MGETGTIVWPVPDVPAIPSGLAASSWLVADLTSGEVLAARNPHRLNRPASTLKTLTALALLPRLDLTARVAYTFAEADAIKQADGLSTAVGLQVGHTYPAARLLEAMLVASANDAAEALAGSLPGGRRDALELMNAEASRLQALDTKAGTPSGLDAPGQYTSAYDLALFARAALALPAFRAADGAAKVTLQGDKGTFGDYSHNRLLNSYRGAYAGKDGFTKAAGQVWWGAAEQGGRRLLVVVVNAGAMPVTQEVRLLDWGFVAAPFARPVGQLVDPLAASAMPAPVAGGPTDPAAVGPPVAAAVAERGGPKQRDGDGGVGRWLSLLLGVVGLALVALRVRARRGRPLVTSVRGPGRAGTAVRPPAAGRSRARHAAPRPGVGRLLQATPLPDLRTGAVRLVRPGDTSPD